MPQKSNRRKQRIEKKVNKEKVKPSKKSYVVLIIIFTLILTIALFIYSVLKTDLGGTFTVAAPSENGDGVLTVFAITEEKVTRFVVPSETLMDVSLQRGEWRMGSVWKLIEGERLNRNVYSNTLIKSLNVPVDGWYEREVKGLRLLTAKSSLNIFQKLKLFLFESSVARKDREEINFSETSYLFEAKLTDGEDGYRRQNEMSSKLRHYFVSPEIANAAEKFEIVNATGSYIGNISSMVKTLETMGVHVLSVKEESLDEHIDCVISSNKQTETVSRIMKLFNCKYDRRHSGSFDAVVTIGERFLNRY